MTPARPETPSPNPLPQGGEGLSCSLSPLGERAGVRGSSAHAERRRRRANTTPQSTTHLHIDRLVLHGVSQSDTARLAAAIERELTTLAAQSNTHFAPFATESLRAQRIVPGRTPEHTGRRAAGAVWSSIAASGAPR